MNRIEKAQILLEQCEKDLERMQQITEELKKIYLECFTRSV